jgi:hypothetical protein
MHLPAPLRAAVGLVVTAADEAKHLPDRAIELPMLAVSTALQMSLRAQQRYARLAERGDAVLNRREVGDEPPDWATFDEFPGTDVSPGDAAEASRLISDLFGTDTPTLNGAPVAPTDAAFGADASAGPVAKKTASKAAKKAAKKASKKAPKKTAAKATNRAPGATSASAGGTAAKKTGAKSAGGGKSVSKPRTGTPSRFDAVEDD